MRRPVQEKWESFEREVLPEAVGQAQRQDMRCAFYAGAASLLGLLLAQLESGTEPSDNDLRLMDAVEKDIATHTVEMMLGRAQ